MRKLPRPLSRNIVRLEREAKKQKRVSSSEWLYRVDVEDFLERLSVNNISQATVDELKFSCPFTGHAHGDEKPSAYMNTGVKDKKRATVWYCHGCGRSGNAITFLSEYEEISKTKAAEWIKEIYSPGFIAPRGGSIAAEFEERLKSNQSKKLDSRIVIPWERYEELFTAYWRGGKYGFRRYMFERGFSIQTLEEWNFGYDERSKRVVFPVFDGNDLVGVKGRTLANRKPKYLIIGDREGKKPYYGFKPYEKSLYVFGANHLDSESKAVLVEGELDAVALAQVGIKAISTGSAAMSKRQELIIRNSLDHVIIWFDSDSAGQRAVWGYENNDGEWRPGLVERLEAFIDVSIVNSEHDPADFLKAGKLKRIRTLVNQARSSHVLAGPV